MVHVKATQGLDEHRGHALGSLHEYANVTVLLMALCVVALVLALAGYRFVSVVLKTASGRCSANPVATRLHELPSDKTLGEAGKDILVSMARARNHHHTDQTVGETTFIVNRVLLPNDFTVGNLLEQIDQEPHPQVELLLQDEHLLDLCIPAMPTVSSSTSSDSPAMPTSAPTPFLSASIAPPVTPASTPTCPTPANVLPAAPLAHNAPGSAEPSTSSAHLPDKSGGGDATSRPQSQFHSLAEARRHYGRYLVFLSHSGSQKEDVVAVLKERLEQAFVGGSVLQRAFLDEQSMVSGDYSHDHMHFGMHDAAVVVFLISKEFLDPGRSRYPMAELAHVWRRHQQEAGDRVIIVPVTYNIEYNEVIPTAKRLWEGRGGMAIDCGYCRSEQQLAGGGMQGGDEEDPVKALEQLLGNTTTWRYNKEQRSVTKMADEVVAAVEEQLRRVGKLPVHPLLDSQQQLIGIEEAKLDVIELLETHGVVSLHGLSGVGKSALAYAVYDDLVQTAFGTRAWHGKLSHDPSNVVELQKDLLRCLTHVRNPVLATAEAGCNLIAEGLVEQGKPVLLLVDNVTEESQLKALLSGRSGTGQTSLSQQLKDKLPPGSMVLLTSIGKLPNVDTDFEVKPLSPDNARMLFNLHAGIQPPQRMLRLHERNDNPNEMLELCHYLPQGLRVAGSHFAELKRQTQGGDRGERQVVLDIVRDIKKLCNKLDEEVRKDLFPVFEASFQRLSSSSQSLLLDIAHFFAGEDWYRLVSLQDNTAQNLLELKRSNLVSIDPHSRAVTLHSSVREFCIDFCCRHLPQAADRNAGRGARWSAFRGQQPQEGHTHENNPQGGHPGVLLYHHTLTTAQRTSTQQVVHLPRLDNDALLVIRTPDLPGGILSDGFVDSHVHWLKLFSDPGSSAPSELRVLYLDSAHEVAELTLTGVPHLQHLCLRNLPKLSSAALPQDAKLVHLEAYDCPSFGKWAELGQVATDENWARAEAGTEETALAPWRPRHLGKLKLHNCSVSMLRSLDLSHCTKMTTVDVLAASAQRYTHVDHVRKGKAPALNNGTGKQYDVMVFSQVWNQYLQGTEKTIADLLRAHDPHIRVVEVTSGSYGSDIEQATKSAAVGVVLLGTHTGNNRRLLESFLDRVKKRKAYLICQEPNGYYGHNYDGRNALMDALASEVILQGTPPKWQDFVDRHDHRIRAEIEYNRNMQSYELRFAKDTRDVVVRHLIAAGRLTQQFPAPTSELFGCWEWLEQECGNVIALLRQHGAVLLHGMFGAGKTTLTQRLFEKLTAVEFFAQGTHCELLTLSPSATNADIRECQRKILAGWNGSREEQLPISTAEGHQRLRQAFVEGSDNSRRRFLLVIDNVWNVQQQDANQCAHQLAELLPREVIQLFQRPSAIGIERRMLLLVTSRDPEVATVGLHMAKPGAAHGGIATVTLHLAPMPTLPDDLAKELFCRHAFRLSPEQLGTGEVPPAVQRLGIWQTQQQWGRWLKQWVGCCANNPMVLEGMGRLVAEKIRRGEGDQLTSGFLSNKAGRHALMHQETEGRILDRDRKVFDSVGISFWKGLPLAKRLLLVDVATALHGGSWQEAECYGEVGELEALALVKRRPEGDEVFWEERLEVHEAVRWYCQMASDVAKLDGLVKVSADGNVEVPRRGHPSRIVHTRCPHLHPALQQHCQLSSVKLLDAAFSLADVCLRLCEEQGLVANAAANAAAAADPLAAAEARTNQRLCTWLRNRGEEELPHLLLRLLKAAAECNSGSSGDVLNTPLCNGLSSVQLRLVRVLADGGAVLPPVPDGGAVLPPEAALDRQGSAAALPPVSADGQGSNGRSPRERQPAVNAGVLPEARVGEVLEHANNLRVLKLGSFADSCIIVKPNSPLRLLHLSKMWNLSRLSLPRNLRILALHRCHTLSSINLTPCPSLVSLVLTDCRSLAAISGLCSLTALRQLELWDLGPVEERGQLSPHLATTLTSLRLNRGWQREGDARWLSGLQRLERVELWQVGRWEDVYPLLTGEQLKRFKWDVNPWANVGWAAA